MTYITLPQSDTSRPDEEQLGDACRQRLLQARGGRVVIHSSPDDSLNPPSHRGHTNVSPESHRGQDMTQPESLHPTIASPHHRPR